MWLKYPYSVLASIYDPLVQAGTRPLRAHSLARLQQVAGQRILIIGIGSGLDIPHLPEGAAYTGIDLTPAMLAKARQRAATHAELNLHLQEGNALALDFDANQFDVVIMHLILAVVPQPALALQQAEKVLKPGGRVLIVDKFLRPGQWALVRRLINLPLQFIATRTDVVFEDVLAQSPTLQCIEDKPVLASGWFRQIELRKQDD